MAPTDIEIAQAHTLRPIAEIGAKLGLGPDDLEPYGKYKAKIAPHVWERVRGAPDGHLILVTAITPTPAGEGKTTVTIGLGDALSQLGERTAICLREPSLGPVFGVKGGAAGGGYSQVVPMEDINLHFTGDFHAVSAAHNLLAAALDNHLHHGNALGIDPRAITWKRTVDMNDRALRQIVVGLGGKSGGVPREDGFLITPASEVMATLCLASDLEDLRERLGRIVVAYTTAGKPVRAADLKVHGAMAALLRDAVKPNLVQTLGGTPAFVHGGPFGNIAHGTNAIIATRLALKLADYVVTEAGFGADLGAEKFVNIVSRVAGFRPVVAVIVATVRALKLHGGKKLEELTQEDLPALARGIANLEKHIENVTRVYGLPAVVAINRFQSDTGAELDLLEGRVRNLGVPVAVVDVWARGGAGALNLARQVVALAQRVQSLPAGKAADPKGDGRKVRPPEGAAEGPGLEDAYPDGFPGGLRFTYELDEPIKAKIEKVAKQVYGAGSVAYSAQAERSIRRLERHELGNLPVCMAKTQYSLSDQPELLGRPEGFTLTVRDVVPSAGAGFVVAITGEILTMPGLPREPAAERIDIDRTGRITGLF
ncbi:formate--tetrahydrofolate ligase [Caldinitratiruptor microaerophilus]|uniref:Formate--tetrahydrofolate ligase n=1 Tax=Caldinitratiruptor microaerophilus TaxID=671077 RepID=A0AA35GB75_9FIRM|nr:formate--tetrahydrofolate ligase [Caldinitratiruptor microaerophilus]BDG62059.1 formate--tetrahydrofolate ligase [Caldinitratiruptor microaerophilus]